MTLFQSNPHPHPPSDPHRISLPASRNNGKRKGHRSHGPAPLKGSSTTPSTAPTRDRAKTPIASSAEQEQQLDMAASFLQFCATCERQIFTPNNCILYCSEACRRKDSCKPVSFSADAMSPTISPPPSTSSSPRPILPSRIPTGASYGSETTYSSRIPEDIHNAKSDLDPTEWKPKLHGRGVSTNSEAFRYLARFHPSTTNGDDEAIGRVQRPALNPHHRSTTSIASLNTTHTPSLAQSPTTAPSSLSTNASFSNLGYDFNVRPLPPRQNPSYSSSAGTTKGIDLVMPHAAPPAAPVVAGSAPDHVHFHGGVWEKQTIRKLPRSVAGDAKEGLASLFGGVDTNGKSA